MSQEGNTTASRKGNTPATQFKNITVFALPGYNPKLIQKALLPILENLKNSKIACPLKRFGKVAEDYWKHSTLLYQPLTLSCFPDLECPPISIVYNCGEKAPILNCHVCKKEGSCTVDEMQECGSDGNPIHYVAQFETLFDGRKGFNKLVVCDMCLPAMRFGSCTSCCVAPEGAITYHIQKAFVPKEFQVKVVGLAEDVKFEEGEDRFSTCRKRALPERKDLHPKKFKPEIVNCDDE